jgi:Type I restriction modification DNA specificity domain
MGSLKKLKEIARIRAGYPFRGRIDEDLTATTCVIQMRDITENTFVNWDTLVHAVPDGKRKADWLEANDILFIAKGNNNLSIFLESAPLLAVCSPHFYHLQVKVENVRPAFLAWAINQKPAQEYLRKNREGSGTLSVRRAVLENMPLSVPSMSTQYEIIALDHLVQKEKATFKNLIQNRQLMMDSVAYSIVDHS